MADKKYALEQASRRVRRNFWVAYGAALTSTFKYRHGALLTKSGRLLRTAHNQNRGCRFGAQFCTHQGRATLHAELGVLLGQSARCVVGSDVFVVRVGSRSRIGLSAPCPMCRGAMIFLGVRRCFYSIDDTYYGILQLHD